MDTVKHKNKIALHWQILIGVLLGVIGGALGKYFDLEHLIEAWISPWGVMFIKALKMLAIPLILVSIIKGISDLGSITLFKNMGGQTMIIYVITTLVSITIGLVLVNVFKPGEGLDPSVIAELSDRYSTDSKVQGHLSEASKQQQEESPLNFLVEMIPSNVFESTTNNSNMLQIIFFSMFFGICMLLSGERYTQGLRSLLTEANTVILKMVDLIMLVSPYAVFALIANVVSTSDQQVMLKVLSYAAVVILGLACIVGFYMLLIKFVVKRSPLWFLKQISPAQLMAFSTSSSAATLPVTMERVEEHVGVDEEVSSFVLPLGATINMDGTSLYQAIAAVFILQILAPELTGFGDQVSILLTALVASIGSAAVPGAGMVMLIIVLESVGFPAEKLPIALALVFAVDRPLDMLRTVVNVTGDATVSTLVAKRSGKLKKQPKSQEWDDHLEEVS